MMFMKKRIFAFLLVLFVFAPAFSAAAHANPVSVTIDGAAVTFPDASPAIIDGRTLVPVRAVFEALGFAVQWNGETQTATISKDGDIIIITIGSAVFTTNGAAHALDVPAQIIGGSTMVPIRLPLESVGFAVDWVAATQTVTIETPAVLLDPILDPIPNRRLTEAEIASWINSYNQSGGHLEFELEVIRLVNIEREAAGVAPLVINNSAMMAARFKAQSMVHLGYFSHTSPVYGSFHIIGRDVFNISIGGENLASGQRTPAEVVNGWMNSPGHRENILMPGFREIGVGFYENRWVQKFIW